ncbi:DUF7344 domain-containing protein [Haladaptatus sp. NG-SE-30]
MSPTRMNRPRTTDTTQFHGGLNTLFDCLANQDRRQILSRLHEVTSHGENKLALGDITIDTEDVELFETQLHHVHLPKLEAAGFVEWNHDTDAIERGSYFDVIVPFVALTDEYPDESLIRWQ